MPNVLVPDDADLLLLLAAEEDAADDGLVAVVAVGAAVCVGATVGATELADELDETTACVGAIATVATAVGMLVAGAGPPEHATTNAKPSKKR